MEATLRPYDRGEEVKPFATLGLYHARGVFLLCPDLPRRTPDVVARCRPIYPGRIATS